MTRTYRLSLSESASADSASDGVHEDGASKPRDPETVYSLQSDKVDVVNQGGWANHIGHVDTIIQGADPKQIASEIREQFEQYLGPFVAPPRRARADRTQQAPADLPRTEEDVVNWFYNDSALSKDERAFVLALTLLHEGSNALVEEASRTILRSLLSKKELRELDSPLSRHPRQHLPRVVRRVAGGVGGYVAFADTDENGTSHLRVLLRSVVGELWESASANEGQAASLRRLMDGWIADVRIDMCAQASRGWGWLMARTDRSLLRSRLSQWAQSSKTRDGIRAAAALQGATQEATDSDTAGDHALADAIRRDISRLLEQWATANPTAQGDNQRWTAVTAAAALAFIAPAVAEDTLVKAMEYPISRPSQRDMNTASFQAPLSLVLPYLLGWYALADAGHLRNVIYRLAQVTLEAWPNGTPGNLARTTILEGRQTQWKASISVLAFLAMGSVETRSTSAAKPFGSIEVPADKPLELTNDDGANMIPWLALADTSGAAADGRQHVVDLITVGIGLDTRLHEQVFAMLECWARPLLEGERQDERLVSRLVSLLEDVVRECRAWDDALVRSGRKGFASIRFKSELKKWETRAGGRYRVLYTRLAVLV